MKARSAIALVLAAALVSGTLAGCGDNGTEKDLTDAALSGEYLADFSAGDPGAKVLFATQGYTNGSVFNTQWDASQLTYTGGQMHLGLAENPGGSLEERTQWYGGEARTAYYYGYGDYEVRMKPSTSVGTASTFFVCTGDYDVWPDGTKNPWDEIDIEFLGKDTTKVQFNYFANGTGGHEHMYDLGFDASEDFHNYGFRWAETYITWFVDGMPVYRVDKADVKAGEAFPKTAGRILMNYWAGAPGTGENTAEGWMGKFNGPDGKTADYQWVKTSAAKQAPPMGDPYAPAKGDAYEGDWSKETAADLAFADAEEYKVALSSDKKSADVTYTDVAGNSYHNVNMDVSAAAAGHGFLQLTVKNNGTAPVALRINVQSADNKPLNAAASQDGEKVNTDLVWGGSFFTVAAGKTAVCEVKYIGVAATVELMIDSSTNLESKSSGNVTVSGLKFAGEGEEPPKPDTTDWSAAEAQELGFKTSEPFTVALSADKKSADITYTAAQGATYTNVEMDAPAAAEGADMAHFTVKNNGEKEVYLRISLVNNEKDAENAASGYAKSSDVNVSATMNGAAADTNVTNGGSYFTIPAGAEVECVIKFDGVVDRIQLMPDTSKWGDAETHAGSLTVSALKFAKSGETPAPAPAPSGDPVALVFTKEETSGYTLSAADENKTWTLSYVGKGNTYSPVTAECAAFAAGKNTFTITIKNEKETPVTVRVDVQGTTKVDTSNGDGSGSGTDCTNKTATCDGGTDLYTDLVWGGTKVTLAAGEEVTLTITYDGTMAQGAVKNILIFVDSMGGDENDHDASVTVSKFLFSGEE